MSTVTPDILAVSLATTPEVGTNVRGQVSGAGWLYALPGLEGGRVVCLGLPPAPTLAALVRVGRVTLRIADGDVTRARAAATTLPDAGIIITTDDALEAEPIDLLVITDDPPPAAALTQLLARVRSGGVAIDLREGGRGGDLPVPDPNGWTQRTYRRWPDRGEIRGMVPADGSIDAAALERAGLLAVASGGNDRSIRARALRWLRRRTRRRGRWGAVRTAIRLPAAPAGPPAYLRELAASAGHDLSGWGWAVAARGDYDSQKVLVLLREPEAAEPGVVVKVTRSSTHAERLANEARALADLASSPSAAGRVPVPWFSGVHAGRAVLAQSLLSGAPFRTRATFTADDPLLTDALGWLQQLGVETARPVPAADVAAVLDVLLDRFERVYRPADEERVALRAVVDRSRGARPIPLVRQHGDPGIWNLLASDDGRALFLDWEASETDGLPLWDTLYLHRSYAIAASKRRGIRDATTAARGHLVGSSPLAVRLRETIDAYMDAVGVPAEAVEALTYGCWIHRALKEANRLPAGRLQQGAYAGHIRLLLEASADKGARQLGQPSGIAAER